MRTALATVASRISVAEYAELMKRLLAERAWLLARIVDETGLKRLGRRCASASTASRCRRSTRRRCARRRAR